MDSESFFKGFWTAIKLGRHFAMGLISKFITRNGTYIAANDGADGYSTVTVNVTPEFTAADEGKVVDNGALVAQTSRNIDANGTYDTTLNNSVSVNVSGGGSALYTNGFAPQSTPLSVDGFAKLANTSVRFGNNGNRVLTNLGINDESVLNARMTRWDANESAYYDAEYLIGAYGGYDFGGAVNVAVAKFWIGRYTGQNKTLIATIEVLDGSGNWVEVEDLGITTSLPYPTNVFTVPIAASIYGIRWHHKKQPQKSSNNNICFFGMVLYGIDTSKPTYIPQSSGLIEPPAGYDGFGTLYIP